jgi:hypothetical protein
LGNKKSPANAKLISHLAHIEKDVSARFKRRQSVKANAPAQKNQFITITMISP